MPAGEHATPWEYFKGIVSEHFALTRSEILDVFFALSPSGGEDGATFILRVEAARVRLLRLAVLPAEVYRAFVCTAKLPWEFCLVLEHHWQT